MFRWIGRALDKLRQRHRLQTQIEGRMHVGSDFTVRTDQFPVQITVRQGAELVIGDRVFVNQGANILATTYVEIGSDSKIADLAAIRDTDTHPVDATRIPKAAPVRVGRNVWLGRGALVMPGVAIGDHAVIAAGAIVVDDVRERTIVGGVPARQIGVVECPDDWRRP